MVHVAHRNRSTEELAQSIREHVVNMTSSGGSSHVGSALSMADLLAVLYGSIMKTDPKNPKMADRDRFILSKGHAGAGVYATLAEIGFFPTELLKQHYQNGSIFSGHVSHKGVPGVELSTGALGHGLGIGAGIALAAKRKNLEYRSFVLSSDGECDEGSVWEAAMFASHHRLSNLVLVIDYNKIQSLDLVANTLALEPFADKWRAFGWGVSEVNGHDHDELRQVFSSMPFEDDKPNVIIAHTTKGKGVSFMENNVLWHYRSPQGEELASALAELSVLRANLEQSGKL